ncbi:MAG: AAA family ATPase [Planctomycetota bacterium]|nr:AAA family ATPase [Planctomycetota bacterium]
MRVVVTGQVGIDKKAFLERAVAAAGRAGCDVTLCNVGERMYAEAPDVPAGKILDLPLSRLNTLRRSVFKDILAAGAGEKNIIVNTHATFRWRHGLFYAFDYDLMGELAADLYITLVDNIDRVHARLLRDGHTNHTLKDLMVWREEEILATELLSQIVGGHGCFYILSRGPDDADDAGPAEMLARLIANRKWKKTYISFPMTNIDEAETVTRIRQFRTEMKRYFICFDPGDLEEKYLCGLALAAAEAGDRFVPLIVDGRRISIETIELLAILPDIDGQIYARDFKLIDQSDMIISLIPAVPVGDGSSTRPGISSGVERELQHAHEAAKDVFVIWTADADPSPFITETATRVFRSVGEAVVFFAENNFIPNNPLGRLLG